MQRVIAVLLIFSIFSTWLYTEEAQDTTPAPYKPDEFPEWTMDLRRFEIVTVGSLPLSFIFTAIVYDLSLLASDSYYYNPDDAAATIPQFGSHRTQTDIVNLLLISAGVSLAVGITDLIIQKVKKSKIEKEKQELDEQRKNNSQSAGLSEDES